MNSASQIFMPGLLALSTCVPCFASLDAFNQVAAQSDQAQEARAAEEQPAEGPQQKLPSAQPRTDKSASNEETGIERKEQSNSKEDERAERDLQAQEAMASWAQASFWVSVIGVVVSTVGLAVIAFSLHLNREATRAAQDAVRIARSALELEARAWLSATPKLGIPYFAPTHEGRFGSYLEVECLVENHGDSPATHVEFFAEMWMQGHLHLTGPERLQALMKELAERPPFGLEAVFPDSEAVLKHMVFLPAEEVEKRKGKASPVILGVLNYRSAESATVRQTAFALAICDKKGEQAMVWTPLEGNRLASAPVYYFKEMVVAT